MAKPNVAGGDCEDEAAVRSSADRVGDDQQTLPVPAVDERAGREGQDEDRQSGRELGDARLRRRVRDCEHE